jgi:hypothetical protein
MGLLLLAFFVRVLILVVRPPLFPPGWGAETASVALAISTGQGFSDPYWTVSGPTAIVPPVYTYLLAVLFSIFGYTVTAGLVAYALNVVLSTLVVWPLARLGSAIDGPRLGILAALLWAVYPLSGFSDILFVWDTSLFALLITVSLLATVHMRKRTALRDWLVYGLIVGLMVVTETVGVVIAGCSVIWLFFYSQVPRRNLIVAVVVMGAMLLPWAVRNTIVFNELMFLRSNFGLEFYESINYNDLESIEPEKAIATRNPNEMQAYLDLGELAYMDGKLQGALRWVEANPMQWLEIVARRYWAFWTGSAFIVGEYWFWGRFELLKRILFALPGILGLIGAFVLLRQRKPEGWLFAGIFLLFPMIYTVALSYPRFRLPIEPLLVLCTSVVLLPVAVRVFAWFAERLGITFPRQAGATNELP